MHKQITVDSFHIGQQIEDVLAHVRDKPKVQVLMDDGERRYDFPSGLSIRTSINDGQIIAIRGGREITLPDATRLNIGDSIEAVLRCLGEPVQKMEGCDLDWDKGPYTDKEIEAAPRRILRVAYVVEPIAIRFDFLREPKIDLVSIRKFSQGFELL